MNNLAEQLNWAVKNRMPAQDSLLQFCEAETKKLLQTSINLDFSNKTCAKEIIELSENNFDENFDDYMPDDIFYEIPDMSSSMLPFIVASDIPNNRQIMSMPSKMEMSDNASKKSESHSCPDFKSNPFQTPMPKVHSYVPHLSYPLETEHDSAELERCIKQKNDISNRLCDLLDSSENHSSLIESLKTERRLLDIQINLLRAKLESPVNHNANNAQLKEKPSSVICNDKIDTSHSFGQDKSQKFKTVYPWTKHVKKALREYAAI